MRSNQAEFNAVLAHEQRQARRRLLVSLAVIAAMLAVLAVMLVRSMPPRTVRIATGEPGGAYHTYAQRYQAILARDGVKLELVETNGSLDNLKLLQDPRSGISVALMQGGVTTRDQAPGLASLGTLAYEPVWAFYRGEDVVKLEGWAAGKKISVGPEGSGTRKVALDVINLLGMDEQGAQLLALPTASAVQALLDGQIDMVVLVSPLHGVHVQRLLAQPEIKMLSYRRADAYVALRPYLNKLLLPQGVIDMRHNRPPQDVALVAPEASLVVRESLHPAIQYLLLQAAVEVHSAPALFQQAGQFPAAQPVDVPLSEPAINYYKSGSPLLQRYLPFWGAALVAELLRLLIPVVAVAYPLLRVAPGVYGWGMRRRIFRLYGELKFIETQLEARDAQASVEDLRKEIDWLEARAYRMRMPKAFAQMLYTLRLHIGLVRQRLEQR